MPRIATALCEIVHAGGSYVSFGGIMMLLYYDAESGQVHYLDAQYNVPLQEKNAGSIPKEGRANCPCARLFCRRAGGPRSLWQSSVPTDLRTSHCHGREGRSSQPSHGLVDRSKKSVLSRLPETKKIFTRHDGKFYVEGDLFRQPELAATLKKVALWVPLISTRENGLADSST